MPSRNTKATKEQLTEDVRNGLTIQDIMKKYGYSSICGVKSALKRAGLPYITQKKAKRIANDPINEDLEKLFENPIAEQNWTTGEGFNKLEEFWANESCERVVVA